MRRLASIACAGLMLGGCWYHESDVSAFGPDDLPATAPFADGVYCTLEADEGALELSDLDCLGYAWNAEQRLMVVTDLADDEAETFIARVLPIGEGLTLIEHVNPDVGDDEAKYLIGVMVATAEGHAVLPRPAAARLVSIAQSAGVVLGDYDPDAESDYPRIIGGQPEAVRAFALLAAEAWLDAPAPEGVDKFAQDDAAQDDDLGPQYYLRLEALPAARSAADSQQGAEPGSEPEDADRNAAVAASYARVRAALENAAER
ncbi:MAG: hypothetical protein PVI23_01595 [Maricaulaceae bacterium]|jgi:hypothetical protein